MPCSGPRGTAARALRIERIRRLARSRVHGGDRVQRRPLLVVGLDPRQVELDQLPRRDLARLHRALQVLDGLLHHVERHDGGVRSRPPRLAANRRTRGDGEHNADQHEHETKSKPQTSAFPPSI